MNCTYIDKMLTTMDRVQEGQKYIIHKANPSTPYVPYIGKLLYASSMHRFIFPCPMNALRHRRSVIVEILDNAM